MCTSEPPFAYRMEESDPCPVIQDTFSERLRRCIMSCLTFYPEHRHDAFDLLRVAQRLPRDYPATEASACWNNLDDTVLKFRSRMSLSSAEDSQILRQQVQNTTNSPFVTEHPAEKLQIESEFLNAEAQTPEGENYAHFNKPSQSRNTQPGHLQMTLSLEASSNQIPEA